LELDVMHQTSRRQLLKGISGIAAGAAAGAAGRGSAPAGTTAGRRAPGSVLWRAQAGTSAQQGDLDVTAGYGMVYAGNTIFPASGPSLVSSLVCAFDADTGTRAWQLSTGYAQLQAVGPGALFWTTTVGAHPLTGAYEIVASDAATGGTLWSFGASQAGANASACYTAGVVIVNHYAGTLTALDARTGRRAWSSPPASYLATATTEGDTVYASGYTYREGFTSSWRLVAMEASTGVQRWRFTGFTGQLLSFAASDGVVGGSPSTLNGAATMFAVNASDGRRRWQTASDTELQAISGGFVISTDLAATPAGPQTLYARHARSGAGAWHRTLAANVQVMTYDDNALYVGGASDNLITALAAGTGNTLWTRRLGAPAQAAAISEGVLYVIDANATVSAIAS
jgi:outer membrane protein assembly factor BamB